MKLVLIEYFQRMPSSKHNPKSKQQPRTKKIIYFVSKKRGSDKDTRILKSHCDLCNDELPKEADNIQYRINVLDEIDNSFESNIQARTSIVTLFLSQDSGSKNPGYFQV